MSGERRERERCQSCGRATAERKPCCFDHLDRLPYVRELLDQISNRETEENAARREGWRAIDPSGSRASEIIDQLADKGAQSPNRLALTVEISPSLLEIYLGALKRAGKVKTLTLGSRRGTPRKVVALARAES